MRKREEHFVTIPLEGGVQALEGIFIAGVDDDAVGIVIAAPHPLYGGSMEVPMVTEIAYAARTAGLASLRFNWRGVGASAGAASGDAAEADADYCAALRHLMETVPGAGVAAGYSFGAASAARVAPGEPRVRRLLLVAPPPSMIDVASLAEFAGSVLLIAGADDSLAPAAELERIAADFPRATFTAIPRADHFFSAGLADVGRITAEWLGESARGRD
jgi:alpha/beta superfamily hydrolase